MTTREAAETAVGFRLIMPADPLASEASLTEIWVHPGTREVALRFSTGVRAYLAGWPAGKPASSLAELVDDARVGWVEPVDGTPVLVLPKDAQAEGYPPQSNVTLVMRGVEISIWGDLTADELLRVVSTL